MEFKKVSAKNDPVQVYATEDGFYKIIKRPSRDYYELKRYSLFNIMGETIGRFETLEEAMNA